MYEGRFYGDRDMLRSNLRVGLLDVERVVDTASASLIVRLTSSLRLP
jgi:hypothetical protein